MDLKTVASVLKDTNLDSAKASGKRRVGNVVLNRAATMIKPQLPMMVRGYVEEPIGKIVLANLLAAVLLKYKHDDERFVVVAEALVDAAADELVVSFDIEGKLDSLIDGLNIDSLKASKGGEK
jgi:hypothetical protein